MIPELNKIYQGDALTVLKSFPDNCVDTGITSPPYWGLRDYQTAKWDGGDPECKHTNAKEKSMYDYSLASSPIQDGERKGTDAPKWKDICPDCGAVKIDNQLGLEKTPEEYVSKLVGVFGEVKRVLKKEGTLWLNLGDSYAGSGKGIGSDPDPKWEGARNDGMKSKTNWNGLGLKPKDLVGIPWMVAFALRADGWYLRSEIIWYKRNPMPESVTDRPTKAHEQIFLLTKSAKYYYDAEAIKEPSFDPEDDRGSRKNKKRFPTNKINGIRNSGIYQMANKRSVWDVTTKPFKDSHFATFPPELISPMILAGSPENGTVLDPFMGAGTTALVARKLNRNFVGIELNPAYVQMAENRLKNELGLFY